MKKRRRIEASVFRSCVVRTMVLDISCKKLVIFCVRNCYTVVLCLSFESTDIYVSIFSMFMSHCFCQRHVGRQTVEGFYNEKLFLGKCEKQVCMYVLMNNLRWLFIDVVLTASVSEK